jgi:predicted membrane metal-binding protein
MLLGKQLPHPLIIFTLSFISGISLAWGIYQQSGNHVAAAATLLLVLCMSKRPDLLMALIVLFGISAGSFALHRRLMRHATIHRLIQQRRSPLACRIVDVETAAPCRTVLSAQPIDPLLDDGIIKIITTKPYVYEYGQELTLSAASIHAANLTMQPGLLRLKILGHVYNKNGFCVKQNASPFSRGRHSLRSYLYQRTVQQLSPSSRTLCAALFFGKKEEKFAELSTSFEYWGLSHLLARSGLHLVLLLFLLNGMLRLLPLALRWKNLLRFLLIVLYMGLSWNSVSFLRSFLQATIGCLCAGTGLPRSAPHTTALAALFLVFYDPINALCLDFQLSFLFAAVLAWQSGNKASNRLEA